LADLNTWRWDESSFETTLLEAPQSVVLPQ
jgi:hypothetical protein